MAFTAAQQAKIDAAQKRLDKAKLDYQSWVTTYSNQIAKIQPCYNNVLEGAAAASTWFNPTTGPCKAAGACKVSECKDDVDIVNNTIIPQLRPAYNEQIAAQQNFDKVLAEVNAEVNADPNTKIEIAEALAAAQALRQKWIFGTVAVLIIGTGIFIWWKWGRKKA